jgi:methylmalonyl-CoA mutase
MPRPEKLFGQFPPVSTREWMERILTDLKGADFNKKLVWKTYEGFNVMPFYRREDIEHLDHIKNLPGDFPYVRGAKTKDNRWLIRQNIEVDDWGEANKKALEILIKGVDSLGFVILDPETVSQKNIETLLRDIHLENVEINFLSAGKAQEILMCLIKTFKDIGTDLNKVRGAIEADPLGRLMMNGSLCISLEAGLDYLTSLTLESSPLPLFKTIHINASNFPNAGSDIVQELAFALSMGNDYMTYLTGRGVKADEAALKIRFSFGIGSNYFFEIAKLRAARLLWSVIAGAYNPERTGSVRMEIHCVTGRWNKTIYDPYINLLRTQTEAMSAALGGTDSLTVEPFDTIFRQPDEFSERIARNQQLLLKEESFFDKVADPAGGSYYIEKLTSLIADCSWKLFLTVQDMGGFLSALENGYIQKDLKESADQKRENISMRKEILLGTNQYPDFDEKVSPGIDLNKVFSSTGNSDENIVEAIRMQRGSEDLEKIRITAEMAPKRPVAFMLTIGDPAMRKARSQFSSNFFACGGYIVKDNKGFGSVENGVVTAMEAGADIIVVCSSDMEYATLAPEVFERVKGRAIVVVAGNPACIDDLKMKGIEYFIGVHTNIIDSLMMFNRLLGINSPAAIGRS